MNKIDPFAVETVILRKPLTLGERTVNELNFQPPKVKDLLAAGMHPEGSIGFTRALLSSLTGESELIINEMIPEDWADCLVILSRTYMRFTGHINLIDTKEEEKENPTNAATLPPNSLPTSAALPES